MPLHTYCGCIQRKAFIVSAYVDETFNPTMTLSCAHACTHTHTPSLSSIVMTEVLGEPISTTSGLFTEVIINVKYSNSSAVLSSIGETIKMADS